MSKYFLEKKCFFVIFLLKIQNGEEKKRPKSLFSLLGRHVVVGTCPRDGRVNCLGLSRSWQVNDR